jgi:protein KRI1
MAKTKGKVSENGAKRRLLNDDPFLLDKADRPTKKAKLLDESDEDEDADEGGVALKVNEDYARRFEHNKKREEKHRCG